MPNLTGEKMSQEMLSIQPELPIILSSGYNDYVDEAVAKKMGIRCFLAKPVKISELSVTISKLMA